jgi:histone-lysine N-methyltransferase SETMAR
MDQSELRFVIKFLFLKGLGAKAIHKELTAVLGPTAYSLTQVKEWRSRFAAGDFSCEDQIRSGRPPHVLGKPLSDFLEEFPFASAGVIAQYFNQSKTTIKEILDRELGLRRFSRRWVPHSLSPAQKVDRMQMSFDLLTLLHEQEKFSFSRIVTGDESWFLYLYESHHMFAASRDEVIPRKKPAIGTQKVMLTIFFSGEGLISLQALPPGVKFTQDYFVNSILPDIANERGRIFNRIRRRDFFLHMDNSMCHNGRMVTEQIDTLKLDRVPHPPYSPDLSPCDFWLFGMLKHKIEDRVFRTTEEIVATVRKVWSEVTLAELQSVFRNWIQRLEYVIDHGGEYYTN